MADRQNLPHKYRLQMSEPHMTRIFIEERDKAIKSIRESEEYKSLLEQWMDDPEFNEHRTLIRETNVEKLDDYLKIVEKLLKVYSNEDLVDSLYYILGDYMLQTVYNISSLMGRIIFENSKEVSSENWKSIVKELYLSLLDERIENSKKEYADRKIGFSQEYMPWGSLFNNQKEKDAFDALFATMPTTDLDKQVELIRNGLDYKALVITK